LDWRDCDYSDYYNSNDTWILFDATNNSAKIDWNDDDFIDEVTNVQNGAVYKIWQKKAKSIRQNIQNTDYLELYLVVASQNGHPYLQWNQYHTSVSGYYVHKKLTTESGTMTTQHFTTATNLTDTDFTIGNPRFTNDEVEYWITAELSPTTQSLEGNHVVKYGTSWIQWKRSNKNNTKSFTYELNQNFPNPFNPTTKIKYSIPNVISTEGRNLKVVLKVYDILGNEVATLVNEEKQAAYYEIEFNGANLPAGVYTYRLITENYIETRKMILLK
jgi:hypothetical protein